MRADEDLEFRMRWENDRFGAQTSPVNYTIGVVLSHGCRDSSTELLQKHANDGQGLPGPAFMASIGAIMGGALMAGQYRRETTR